MPRCRLRGCGLATGPRPRPRDVRTSLVTRQRLSARPAQRTQRPSRAASGSRHRDTRRLVFPLRFSTRRLLALPTPDATRPINPRVNRTSRVGKTAHRSSRTHIRYSDASPSARIRVAPRVGHRHTKRRMRAMVHRPRGGRESRVSPQRHTTPPRTGTPLQSTTNHHHTHTHGTHTTPSRARTISMLSTHWQRAPRDVL